MECMDVLWREYLDGRDKVRRFFSLETQPALVLPRRKRIKIKTKYAMNRMIETFKKDGITKLTRKRKTNVQRKKPIGIQKRIWPTCKLSKKENGRMLHHLCYIQNPSLSVIHTQPNNTRIINVLVSVPGAATTCLTLHDEETIRMVKSRLYSKTGVPDSSQRVRYMGRFVRDKMKLKELVHKGNELHLTLLDGCLRGGGSTGSKSKKPRISEDKEVPKMKTGQASTKGKVSAGPPPAAEVSINNPQRSSTHVNDPLCNRTHPECQGACGNTGINMGNPSLESTDCQDDGIKIARDDSAEISKGPDGRNSDSRPANLIDGRIQDDANHHHTQKCWSDENPKAANTGARCKTKHGDSTQTSDQYHGSDSDETFRKTEYTSAQEQEVNRVLTIGVSDCYAVLEVPRNFIDQNVLNRAYRRLAHLLHPDKNKAPRAEEAFKVLGTAYGVLGDPIQRQQYDQAQTDKSEFSPNDIDPDEVFSSFFPDGLHSEKVDDSVLLGVASRLGDDDWFLLGQTLGVSPAKLNDLAGLGPRSWRPLLMLNKWNCATDGTDEKKKHILRKTLLDIGMRDQARIVDEYRGELDQLLALVSWEFVDWVGLGRKLGLHENTLDQIIGLTERPENKYLPKFEMLKDFHHKSGSQCFPRMVEALQMMRKVDILEWIEERTGIECVGGIPDATPSSAAGLPFASGSRIQPEPSVDQSIHFSNIDEGIKLHTETIQKNILRIPLFDLTNTSSETVDLPKTLVSIDLFIGDKDVICMEHNKSRRERETGRTALAAKELFSVIGETPEPQTLLIEGPPGAGKTTFLRAYIYTWAKLRYKDCTDNELIEALGHVWKLIVYVPAETMSSSRNMDEAIRKSLNCYKKERDSLMDYLETDPKYCLIFLDAIDEIRNENILGDIKILIKKGQNAQGPRVVATARDHLSHINIEIFDRCLTCEGYNKTQAHEYIENFFRDGTAENKRNIDHIKNKSYIQWNYILTNPLRLFMTCWSFKYVPRVLSEDITTTHLYESQLNVLLNREALKYKDKKKNSRPTQIQDVLEGFCFLSLRLYLSNESWMSENLLHLFEIPDASPMHVYLTCDHSFDFASGMKNSKKWKFAHETLFEFFAAKGLLQLDMETQRRLLLHICSNARNNNFLVFLFGLMGRVAALNMDRRHLEDVLTAVLLLQGTYKGAEASSFREQYEALDKNELLVHMQTVPEFRMKSSFKPMKKAHSTGSLNWKSLTEFLSKNEKLAKNESWFSQILRNTKLIDHTIACCKESCQDELLHNILKKMLPCISYPPFMLYMLNYPGTWSKISSIHSELCIEGCTPRDILETLNSQDKNLASLKERIKDNFKEMHLKCICRNPRLPWSSITEMDHFSAIWTQIFHAESTDKYSFVFQGDMNLGHLFAAVIQFTRSRGPQSWNFLSGAIDLISFLEFHRAWTSSAEHTDSSASFEGITLTSEKNERLGKITFSITQKTNESIPVTITSHSIENMRIIIGQLYQDIKIPRMSLCFTTAPESAMNKRNPGVHEWVSLLRVVQDTQCAILNIELLPEIQLESLFEAMSQLRYLSGIPSISLYRGIVHSKVFVNWTEKYILESDVFNIKLQNIRIEDIPEDLMMAKVDSKGKSFGALIVYNDVYMQKPREGIHIEMGWQYGLFTWIIKLLTMFTDGEHIMTFSGIFTWLNRNEISVSSLGDGSHLIKLRTEFEEAVVCFNARASDVMVTNILLDRMQCLPEIKSIQISVPIAIPGPSFNGTSDTQINLRSQRRNFWSFQECKSQCVIDMHSRSSWETAENLSQLFRTKRLNDRQKRLNITLHHDVLSCQRKNGISEWKRLLNITIENLCKDVTIHLPPDMSLKNLLDAIKENCFLSTIADLSITGGTIDAAYLGDWMVEYRKQSEALNISCADINITSSHEHISSLIACATSEINGDEFSLTVLTPRDGAAVLEKALREGEGDVLTLQFMQAYFTYNNPVMATSREFERFAWAPLLDIVKQSKISRIFIYMGRNNISGLLDALSAIGYMDGKKVRIYEAQVKLSDLESWTKKYRHESRHHNVSLDGTTKFESTMHKYEQGIEGNSALLWSRISPRETDLDITAENLNDLKFLLTTLENTNKFDMEKLAVITHVKIKLCDLISKYIPVKCREAKHTKDKWLECIMILMRRQGLPLLTSLTLSLDSKMCLGGFLEALVPYNFLPDFQHINIIGGFIENEELQCWSGIYSARATRFNIHLSKIAISAGDAIIRNVHSGLPWLRLVESSKGLVVKLHTPSDHLKLLLSFGEEALQGENLLLQFDTTDMLAEKTMVKLQPHLYQEDRWLPLLDHLSSLKLKNVGISFKDRFPLKGFLSTASSCKSIGNIDSIYIKGGTIESGELTSWVNSEGLGKDLTGLRMEEVNFQDRDVTSISLKTGVFFSQIFGTDSSVRMSGVMPTDLAINTQSLRTDLGERWGDDLSLEIVGTLFDQVKIDVAAEEFSSAKWLQAFHAVLKWNLRKLNIILPLKVPGDGLLQALDACSPVLQDVDVSIEGGYMAQSSRLENIGKFRLNSNFAPIHCTEHHHPSEDLSRISRLWYPQKLTSLSGDVAMKFVPEEKARSVTIRAVSPADAVCVCNTIVRYLPKKIPELDLTLQFLRADHSNSLLPAVETSSQLLHAISAFHVVRVTFVFPQIKEEGLNIRGFLEALLPWAPLHPHISTHVQGGCMSPKYLEYFIRKVRNDVILNLQLSKTSLLSTHTKEHQHEEKIVISSGLLWHKYGVLDKSFYLRAATPGDIYRVLKEKTYDNQIMCADISLSLYHDISFPLYHDSNFPCYFPRGEYCVQEWLLLLTTIHSLPPHISSINLQFQSEIPIDGLLEALSNSTEIPYMRKLIFVGGGVSTETLYSWIDQESKTGISKHVKFELGRFFDNQRKLIFPGSNCKRKEEEKYIKLNEVSSLTELLFLLFCDLPSELRISFGDTTQEFSLEEWKLFIAGVLGAGVIKLKVTLPDYTQVLPLLQSTFGLEYDRTSVEIHIKKGRISSDDYSLYTENMKNPNHRGPLIRMSKTNIEVPVKMRTFRVRSDVFGSKCELTPDQVTIRGRVPHDIMFHLHTLKSSDLASQVNLSFHRPSVPTMIFENDVYSTEEWLKLFETIDEMKFVRACTHISSTLDMLTMLDSILLLGKVKNVKDLTFFCGKVSARELAHWMDRFRSTVGKDFNHLNINEVSILKDNQIAMVWVSILGNMLSLRVSNCTQEEARNDCLKSMASVTEYLAETEQYETISISIYDTTENHESDKYSRCSWIQMLKPAFDSCMKALEIKLTNTVPIDELLEALCSDELSQGNKHILIMGGLIPVENLYFYARTSHSEGKTVDIEEVNVPETLGISLEATGILQTHGNQKRSGSAMDIVHVAGNTGTITAPTPYYFSKVLEREFETLRHIECLQLKSNNTIGSVNIDYNKRKSVMDVQWENLLTKYNVEVANLKKIVLEPYACTSIVDYLSAVMNSRWVMQIETVVINQNLDDTILEELVYQHDLKEPEVELNLGMPIRSSMRLFISLATAVHLASLWAPYETLTAHALSPLAACVKIASDKDDERYWREMKILQVYIGSGVAGLAVLARPGPCFNAKKWLALISLVDTMNLEKTILKLDAHIPKSGLLEALSMGTETKFIVEGGLSSDASGFETTNNLETQKSVEEIGQELLQIIQGQNI